MLLGTQLVLPHSEISPAQWIYIYGHNNLRLRTREPEILAYFGLFTWQTTRGLFLQCI